jgi:hypothetical protein
MQRGQVPVRPPVDQHEETSIQSRRPVDQHLLMSFLPGSGPEKIAGGGRYIIYEE